jgi:hypothetical protein
MPTGIYFKNPIEALLATRIRQTKYDCKKRRNLEFDLDLEYLVDLYNKQNGKCALSGWNLECETGGEWYGNKNPRVCSIDRKDNSKGYIKGNVHLTCSYVNNLRGPMPLKEFRQMCRDISNNLQE